MEHRAMSDDLQFSNESAWLVIGLGRSGLASLRVLAQRGARLFATDEGPSERLADAIATAQSLGATFVSPSDLGTILESVDWAVLSPGVPPISPVVQAINRQNISLMGEVELAYRLCDAPVVAVTGTKGKSTTTALIGHILRSCGRNVRVGGNIGNPLIAEVVDAGVDDWVVAEVSSFQLETIRSFKPRVAVLLNIEPDHLDRYPSMDEYAEAKFRIAANQSLGDWFVGNLDDLRVASLDWHHGSARVAARQLWFTLRDGERAAMYVRNGTITYAPVLGDPRPLSLLPCSEVPLPGAHNVANVMAAMLAAIATGCSPVMVASAVKTFSGLHHRLQTIAEIDGVAYVDDSKATTPAAAIAALRSYRRPIVLIAGGRAKRSGFDALGREIRERVKALIVIGEAAEEITGAAGVESIRAESLEEAVRRAREVAQPGDVVLLSPACASFDMFASAEERGERFAAAVATEQEPANA
jgi:UDP-N-acetylmuramoylalanine--D-glutamate ligase